MIYRLLTILLIVTMTFSGCRTSKDPERGRDTREAVVNDFIAAIEDNDLDIISELTSPRKELSRKEIEVLLAPLLGQSIEEVEIRYITEFGPDTVNVLLIGNVGPDGRAKRPFTYRFYVSRLPEERWHLFLTGALQFME